MLSFNMSIYLQLTSGQKPYWLREYLQRRKQIHDSPLVSQSISYNTTSNTPYCDISTLPAAVWVTYIFDSNIFLTVLLD
jgi:hypothetical protein